MAGAKTTSNNAEAMDSLLEFKEAPSKRSRCWSLAQKCCIITAVITFFLLEFVIVLIFGTKRTGLILGADTKAAMLISLNVLILLLVAILWINIRKLSSVGLVCLAFFLVFIGFPMIFMLFADLQRSMLFVPSMGSPERFENINKHVPGTRNLYVTVNEAENITLGVWHLLPQALVNDSVQTESFNYSFSLMQSDHPVLLHFHGNAGNRIYNIDVYLELRHFFHIIAFDYRSFGDSSEAELTEEGQIQDSVQLYKWLRTQTTAEIFFWGHSLGTALSTHTAARLRDYDIIPTGLILEAPYTTLREEALYYSPSKMLSWLPWFNATILDPMEKNGFRFETTKHILKVDCPVMILHAEDDVIIPYFLGEKLAKIAQEGRNLTTQGNTTFHLFPARFGYDHWGIYKAPELPRYIRNHIDICRAYNKGKN